MKLGHSIAGGVCAALISQAALAWIPGTDSPDVTLLISGATASENGIRSVLASGMCVNSIIVNGNPVAQPIDVFEATNQKVVFCTMTSTSVPGLSGTKKVLIRKSGVGGSGNGVGPVCNATSLSNGFMNVSVGGTGGNCTAVATPPGAPVGPNYYACNTTTGGFFSAVPQAGISDVAPNEVYGGSASTGCPAANVFGSYEAIFAIPVTLKLRDALQEAQGLSIGSETAANMPSMSSEMFASILSQRTLKWDEVKTKNGAALTSLSSAPTDTRVTLCQRVPTSGTYAATNKRILQNGCASGALAIGDDNAGLDDQGPVIVGNLSGSGNVETCLGDFNDTGSSGGRTGSNWAVGMLSTDRDPVASGLKYRFVRLNGVLPTFENVANGTYKYTVTSTFQWKSLAGDQLKVAQELQKSSANPTDLGAARFISSWGNTGIMALAQNGFSVGFTAATPPVYDNTKPVTPFTHVTDKLSNCLDPLQVEGKSMILP